MKTFRVYVNEKITDKGGGGHVRFEDVEADDADDAKAKVDLKRGEDHGDVVELAP